MRWARQQSSRRSQLLVCTVSSETLARRCAVQPSHRALGQNSIALVCAYRTAYSAGALRAKARLGLRPRLVDGCQPGAILAAASADDLEIELLQPVDHRPHLAIADRPPVDVDHRRNLCAGAAKEDLIGDIKLGAVD